MCVGSYVVARETWHQDCKFGFTNNTALHSRGSQPDICLWFFVRNLFPARDTAKCISHKNELQLTHTNVCASIDIFVFAKYKESHTRTAETQGYEATV